MIRAKKISSEDAKSSELIVLFVMFLNAINHHTIKSDIYYAKRELASSVNCHRPLRY